MEHPNSELKQYLVPGKTVHLIGIGGVSMRSLGPVLMRMGVRVTGSDRDASSSTKELEEQGVKIIIGHYEDNVVGADCVIRTSAVHDDNPEIVSAHRLGIPVFERAQAWGVIMQGYKDAICISGNHGKTTVTAMVTHIMMEAQRDPTVMIGAYLPLIQSCHRVGQGDTIILESCEYCDSFLSFYPSLSVILNIEEDHLDYFKDLKDIQKSFRKFAELASDRVLVNGDDPHCLQAVDGLSYLTFGFGEQNIIRGTNISSDWQHLDVVCDGAFYCHLDLRVMGWHNAFDAIASAGVAWMLGVPGQVVTDALRDFNGANRRMQFKGTYNGADLFDDFAHHPDEIRALMDVVKTLPYKRFVFVFQPYTYTRTVSFFDDFVKELKRADHLVLAEICAARETDTLGISSRHLQEKIEGSVYRETLPEVTEYLCSIAREGDIIISSGCGDIYKAIEAMTENKEG